MSKINYGEENKRMFYKRRAVQSELDELRAAHEASGNTVMDRETRIRYRMLRRRLEQITEDIYKLNHGLVVDFVRQFTGKMRPDRIEDVRSAGMVGLTSAIQTYDPDKGAFSTWALLRVKRQVLREVRFLEHAMTQTDFEKRARVKQAEKLLRGDDELFEPSDEDIAMMSDIPLDQVRRIRTAPQMVSWQAPIGADDSDGTLGDLIVDDETSVEDTVLSGMSWSSLVKYGLSQLRWKERYVLVRHWGLDGERRQTLNSLGETFDLSREGVRQLEEKGKAKLGHPVVALRVLRHGQV